MRCIPSIALLALTAALSGSAAAPSPPDISQHQFDVTARRYAFVPSRLEVQTGDLVKVTFRATTRTAVS